MMNKERLEALETSKRCRHYAMCKIDALNTGVCPSGRKNHFVSYYPQGLMDITAALLEERIPVTPGLLHAARECTMCGICDLQCHFVTGLRPLKAISVLKKTLEELMRDGCRTFDPDEDAFLRALREITGDRFSTSDPAHLTAYSNDPCPVSQETVPRYVTLPENTRQLAEIVKLCGRNDIPYAVRGNGSSVMGFVLSSGVVIDTARMRTIRFDTGNRSVTVGAGVSSMELQKEARERGFRVNAAEPAALYCANLMCSGIFSLFSSSMGTGLDNIIDAEFVRDDGEVVRLSQENGPNPCAFQRNGSPLPGICTRAVVRLYPVDRSESAIAVPFGRMDEAVVYARELNKMGIGLGTGVLGTEYLGTFLAPTAPLAETLRQLFRNDLEMNYMVLVLGNRLHLKAAAELAPCVLEQDMIRALTLGVTSLDKCGISSVLHGLDGDEPAYTALAEPGMTTLVKAALQPSPEALSEAVEGDLREAYRKLYARNEITDMMWLNDFRIVSSRMGREGHVVAFILYVPLDDPALIRTVHERFTSLAKENELRGDFGFLTPMDRGSMGVLEWDMYLDHTDPEQVLRGRRAMGQAVEMIEGLRKADSRILFIGSVFNQGFCRKESFLHHNSLLEDE